MIKFDVGLDIGTTNTKIYFKNSPVGINIPSVVAIKKNTKEIVGVGKKAYNMLGKAPDTILVKKTISNGVVSDFNLNRIMIKETLFKKFNKNFKKPKVCLCFHSFMTKLEKLVFKNSIFSSDTDNIYLIDESLASGIGAGLDFSNDYSVLVVNFGGGTTDIAAISPTGAVFNKSIKMGAELIDETIRKTLYEDHNLLIGKSTAEKIKKKAVTLINPSLKLKFSIKGKDKITGLPKVLELSQKEICKNIMPTVNRIIDLINDLLNNIPLDLSADIQKNGILLTGGGSLISGFQELVSKKTNILTNIAKNPINCAAFGALNSSTLLNEQFLNFIIPA